MATLLELGVSIQRFPGTTSAIAGLDNRQFGLNKSGIAVFMEAHRLIEVERDELKALNVLFSILSLPSGELDKLLTTVSFHPTSVHSLMTDEHTDDWFVVRK